ncbi:otogelin-like protein [Latimeria chalumnae]|uniref:otogelin-like protein n=1 Tax=Latimeria chalumnae TaxID=7897 RepID=UPI00313CE107
MVKNVFIERLADYILVKTTFGFSLAWDGISGVYIKLTDEHKGKPCGMCGNFNGVKEDDLTTIYQTTTQDVAVFGNSWTVQTPNGTSCRLLSLDYLGPCSSQLRSIDDIFHKCSVLFNFPFLSCHAKIDPNPYIASCLNDLCTMNDEETYCRAVAEYARACSHAGYPVRDWRDDFLACSDKCEEKFVHRDCISCCPPTCTFEKECLGSNLHCLDGCYCPDGLILENGTCISVENCPCIYHGTDYPLGSVLEQDCNTCTCIGGVWNCSDTDCPAECSVVGELHLSTFDGRLCTFYGSCHYILMKSRRNDDFTITMQTSRCGQNQDHSCIQSVTLLMGLDLNKHVTLARGEVKVGVNQVSSFPYSDGGIEIQKLSSLFIQVKTNTGVRVRFTKDGRRLYVQVDSRWKGETLGLCGTFNGNLRDDFLSPAGMIEGNPQLHASSWRMSSTCPAPVNIPLVDPCDTNQQYGIYAAMCDVLNQELFAPCHTYVSPSVYYQQCHYDACTCGSYCLCTLLAHYAYVCAKHNVSVDFRSQVSECGLVCEYNMQYHICSSSCGRTCSSVSAHEVCSNECAEGCNCPNGTYYHNKDHRCVSLSQCPCFFMGHMYQPKEIIPTATDHCQCLDGRMDCSLKPDPEPKCLDREIFHDCKNPPPGLPSTGKNCEVTCANLLMNSTCPPFTMCRSGCVCPTGRVRHGLECYFPELCPCEWKSLEYLPGSVISTDCYTCICQKGAFSCIYYPCPAVCTSYGDRHYHTFDGVEFDFFSDCSTYLVKSTDGPDVSIIATNEFRHGSHSVCGKSLVITAGDTELKLFESSIKQSPFGVNKTRYEYQIRKAGYYTVVHFPELEITVLWDKKTTIHIKVGPQWKGKLSGLCGNFDNYTSNDQTTSMNIVESNTWNFGNSWGLGQCSSPLNDINRCEENPSRWSYAKSGCGVLFKDIFAPCRTMVDVAWYHKNCLLDTCNCDHGYDCDCQCSSIAVYAHQCCQQGIKVHWRSPSVCPYDCEYYNRDLGQGPYTLISYAERDIVLGANLTSGEVFPLPRISATGKILFSFMITPGLYKSKELWLPVVSFECAERPNYFLCAYKNGTIGLGQWEPSLVFHKAATFFHHQGLWMKGYSSFEVYMKRGSFITLTSSGAKVMEYDLSEEFRKASSFSIEESNTAIPYRRMCEWRYEPCASPCVRTCSDPDASACKFLSPVEGCFPYCPSNMVLDEITLRCVYPEDCIYIVTTASTYETRSHRPSRTTPKTLKTRPTISTPWRDKTTETLNRTMPTRETRTTDKYKMTLPTRKTHITQMTATSAATRYSTIMTGITTFSTRSTPIPSRVPLTTTFPTLHPATTLAPDETSSVTLGTLRPATFLTTLSTAFSSVASKAATVSSTTKEPSTLFTSTSSAFSLSFTDKRMTTLRTTSPSPVLTALTSVSALTTTQTPTVILRTTGSSSVISTSAATQTTSTTIGSSSLPATSSVVSSSVLLPLSSSSFTLSRTESLLTTLSTTSPSALKTTMSSVSTLATAQTPTSSLKSIYSSTLFNISALVSTSTEAYPEKFSTITTSRTLTVTSKTTSSLTSLTSLPDTTISIATQIPTTAAETVGPSFLLTSSSPFSSSVITQTQTPRTTSPSTLVTFSSQGSSSAVLQTAMVTVSPSPLISASTSASISAATEVPTVTLRTTPLFKTIPSSPSTLSAEAPATTSKTTLTTSKWFTFSPSVLTVAITQTPAGTSTTTSLSTLPSTQTQPQTNLTSLKPTNVSSLLTASSSVLTSAFTKTFRTPLETLSAKKSLTAPSSTLTSTRIQTPTALDTTSFSIPSTSPLSIKSLGTISPYKFFTSHLLPARSDSSVTSYSTLSTTSTSVSTLATTETPTVTLKTMSTFMSLRTTSSMPTPATLRTTPAAVLRTNDTTAVPSALSSVEAKTSALLNETASRLSATVTRPDSFVYTTSTEKLLLTQETELATAKVPTTFFRAYVTKATSMSERTSHFTRAIPTGVSESLTKYLSYSPSNISQTTEFVTTAEQVPTKATVTSPASSLSPLQYSTSHGIAATSVITGKETRLTTTNLTVIATELNATSSSTSVVSSTEGVLETSQTTPSQLSVTETKSTSVLDTSMPKLTTSAVPTPFMQTSSSITSQTTLNTTFSILPVASNVTSVAISPTPSELITIKRPLSTEPLVTVKKTTEAAAIIELSSPTSYYMSTKLLMSPTMFSATPEASSSQSAVTLKVSTRPDHRSFSTIIYSLITTTLECMPNYFEWVDKCNQYICVNNKRIPYNNSKNCLSPVSRPDCGFRGMPLPTNEDSCCPEWECPCLCSVLSDLSVITFDGNNFALYDATSYILVFFPHEIIVAHIEDCSVTESISFLRKPVPTGGTSGLCFKKLNITINGQLRVLINRMNREVSVNGFVKRLPFAKQGIFIQDTGSMYIINTPAGVTIKWFHSTSIIDLQYGFPSNRTTETRGLCGCCNADPTDDLRLPNGTIISSTEDIEQFVQSWKIETRPLDFRRKAPINCTNSNCTKCFQMLDLDPFLPCHKEVPPYKYCNDLWIQTPQYWDNDCATLSTYASLCNKHNICIKWRNDLFCPLKCPPGKEYQPCVETCSTKTCLNKNYYEDSTCSYFREECVCENGTILHRTDSNFCVTEDRCTCTDNEGFPHSAGEIWYGSNKGCCMYRCLENGSVIAIEPDCTQVPTPECKREGEIVTHVIEEGACCPVKVCECNTTLCDNPVPTCDSGSNLVIGYSPVSCCPVYKCECNYLTCPTTLPPECKEDQFPVQVKQEGSCCFSYLCVCESCIDPLPTCNDGEVLALDLNTTLHCCPQYHCVCDENLCPTPLLNCTNGTKPLKKILPGQCCPEWHCECNCENIMVPSCKLGESLIIDPDAYGICGCTHYICKRDDVCLFQEVTLLKPGEFLIQYFERDLCYTAECLQEKDSLTGYHVMDIKTVNCSEKCRAHQVYIPTPDPLICCGTCKNVSCIFTQQNGTVDLYQPGSTWTSNCTTYQCVDTAAGAMVVGFSIACPAFNQTECVQKGGVMETYTDSCCKTCKDNRRPCQKVTIRTIIRKSDCRSNKPISLVACDGKCSSATIFNFSINKHARFCKCCTETGLQNLTVPLFCTGNQTFIDYVIQEPTGCSCQYD